MLDSFTEEKNFSSASFENDIAIFRIETYSDRHRIGTRRYGAEGSAPQYLDIKGKGESRPGRITSASAQQPPARAVVFSWGVLNNEKILF